MTLQAKAPWGDPEPTWRKANEARRCGGDGGAQDADLVSGLSIKV